MGKLGYVVGSGDRDYPAGTERDRGDELGPGETP